MAAPKLTSTGTGYVLTYDEDPITISVDRIREHHDALRAEVVIRTTAPGVPPHLYHEHLNLLSGRSKDTLAKALEAQYGLIAKWSTVLEQMRMMVLAEHRKGEPEKPITEVVASEAIRYRVKPLIVEKQANLIWGERGTGKGFLSCWLALMVALPVIDGPYDVEPGNVLYLDYESDEEDLKQRMDMVAKGAEYPTPHNVFYRRCWRALQDEAEEVHNIVRRRNISFCIVDSAGLACGGKPQADDMVLPFFGALRRLNLTSLIIAHTQKNAETKTAFGSVYWENMPRMVYEVRSTQQPGDSSLNLGLFHRKVNRGMRQTPTGLRFTFDGDHAVSVSPVNLMDVTDLRNGMPMKDQLIAVLKRGARSIDHMCSELGLEDSDRDRVRQLLNKYKDVFVVMSTLETREKLWGLRAP